MSKPKPLSPKKLAKLAKKAVIQVAASELKGDDAHKAATRAFAKMIDKALKWPPTPWGLAAEALDGPAALISVRLLGGFVQHAFGKLRKKGTV